MSKKRKMDFIIHEESDERLIFRFYPKYSSVHSFNDAIPTSWDDVYKVYYCWAIFKQYKWDENDNWESERLFNMSCDECSILGSIPYIIDEVIKNQNSIYEKVIGYGADWKASYRKLQPIFNDVTIEEDVIDFEVWNIATDQGFRFSLFLSDAIKFKNYINKVSEYMLKNGQPI